MARFDFPLLNIQDGQIPTEQASVAFGLLAGVGGGLAQVIAGRQLSNVPGDTIPIRSLALPIVLAGGSTALAAYLIPSGA